MPAVGNRPFSLSVRSTVNDRTNVMYPNSSKILDSLDVFDPVMAGDNMSSNPRDEDARGSIETFTPEMQDNADGISTINGYALTPGQTPWAPASAFGASAGDPGIPAEAAGFDETKLADRYANSRTPVRNGAEVNAVLEDIRQGFPDQPRPDMRMVQKNS